MLNIFVGAHILLQCTFETHYKQKVVLHEIHDWHIFMQQLLSLRIHGLLDEPIEL